MQHVDMCGVTLTLTLALTLALALALALPLALPLALALTLALTFSSRKRCSPCSLTIGDCAEDVVRCVQPGGVG